MAPPKFLPAIPIPLVVDPKDRIEDLKSLLSEERWKRQNVNIIKLIHMYETGELGPMEPGTETWLCDGKVLDCGPAPSEVPQGSILWCEGISTQMMQNSPPQAVGSQMALQHHIDLAGSHMHEIHAGFRLVPELGGNSYQVTHVAIGNDTGSGIQTIFTTDLTELNDNTNTYSGNIGQRRIQTPYGIMWRDLIQIEMQVMDTNGREMTPWFVERALITPPTPGAQRLSGLAMRNHLYFATAPGNAELYVSVKKHAVVSRLPVV